MNILFFGAGAFGLPALEALKNSSHRLLGIVTTPDKPRGRGRKVTASPLKEWARAAGVPGLPGGNVNEGASLERFRGLGADVFVVISFGVIFSDEFLKTAPRGCVNVHPSLLPKYRGASPVVQAILEGDRTVGTTIMRIAPKLDSGDILLQEAVELEGEENAAQVWDRLADLSGGLLVHALDLLEKNRLQGKPQDENLATYCSKLSKKDGVIDWSLAAPALHNRVRAFFQWPGSVTRAGDADLKVLRRARAES